MSSINVNTPSMMWTEWFFFCFIIFLFWDDVGVEIDNWDKLNTIIDSHYQEVMPPVQKDTWIGNE